MSKQGSLEGLLQAMATYFEGLDGISGVHVSVPDQAVVYTINGWGTFRVEVAASKFEPSVRVAVWPR